MNPWKHQRAREEQARREVGATDVSPAVASALAGAFLTVILSAGVIQVVVDDDRTAPAPTATSATVAPCSPSAALGEFASAVREADAGIVARIVAGNRTLLRRFAACEDSLEDDSVVGRAIRPPVQRLLMSGAGVGNEQVYIGRDGWVFYRPDVDHVTGPGFLEPTQLSRRRLGGDEWVTPPEPDPRPALVDFHAQLAARGITLIVMPTPVKPSIHPERLSSRASRLVRPAQNRAYAQFLDDLRNAGVDVFDPAPALWRAREETGDDQYLATDTHWRPESVARVAGELARFIVERAPLPSRASAGYRLEPVAIDNAGDIREMLDIGEREAESARETVTIERVLTAEGASWAPGDAADVLLLGDSFSNIYSLEAMGWGTGAGLAERLSFELQRPVDRIARNDNGAYATRLALATDLARGRDRLAGTRVVVYQFATRELSFGDWRLVELPTAPAPASDRFLALPGGVERTVAGTVAAASVVPRPGTVPYRDHIRALHLTDVRPVDGPSPLDGREAAVYIWSMQDNVWTDAASYVPGDRITLRVRAWDDVAPLYEGVNRSELDDEDLLLAEPVWGEVAEP